MGASPRHWTDGHVLDVGDGSVHFALISGRGEQNVDLLLRGRSDGDLIVDAEPTRRGSDHALRHRASLFDSVSDPVSERVRHGSS
jgi:hypothetical protein